MDHPENAACAVVIRFRCSDKYSGVALGGRARAGRVSRLVAGWAMDGGAERGCG